MLDWQEAGITVDIVNCTPHPLTIYASKQDKNPLTIPTSGILPRREETREDLPPLNGVPVANVSFGAVIDLPSPKPNTIYVISALTLEAAPQDRDDLYCPGAALRDNGGRQIGCLGLATRKKQA